ncbi:hypothetical protein CUJ87_29625 [Paraburkholderia caledonica]|jgi:hypothetical protein|nr:hypothetical protein CUJ87_29625 [Paraburkholderia caledonica]
MKTSAIAALPFFCMIPSAYAQSSTPRTVNDLVRAQSDVPVDGFGSISMGSDNCFGRSLTIVLAGGEESKAAQPP